MRTESGRRRGRERRADDIRRKSWSKANEEEAKENEDGRRKTQQLTNSKG